MVQLTDPETFEVLTTLVPPDLRNVAALCFSADGARLAVTHNSRVVTLWDLRAVRVQLSAMRLDLAGVPLPPRGTEPAAPLSVAVVPPAWLESIHAGEAHAAAGRWDEAAAAYKTAFESGNRSPMDWSRRALLLLATGKAEGYRTACRDMVEHFAPPLPSAVEDTVAWACVVGGDATADPDGIVRLAEAAVSGRKDYYALNTLGAALYRAGRFEEAFATLERSVAAHASGGTPHDWVFLAMTCQRLGRLEEARAWIERFDRDQAARGGSAAGSWTEPLELRVLRDEAGTLLAVPPSADT